MLQLTAQHRLLLAVEPVDFRKGICGLKGLCLNYLDCDPFSGAIFAFRNRAQTSVKLLVYDASGFWLCQKRFSKGRLAWWPNATTKTAEIRASELLVLLAQGNPMLAAIPKDWKKVNHAASGTVSDNSCW
jgi:transposase